MHWLLLFVVALSAVGCEPPGYHKHDNVDAAASDGTHADAGPDAAPDGHAGDICAQMFQLDGHGGASSVWVTGDFTGWGADPAHGALAMSLSGASWVLEHDFTAGTYVYKFVIDGTMWIADPTNPNVVDDGFGGHNSVISCVP